MILTFLLQAAFIQSPTPEPLEYNIGDRTRTAILIRPSKPSSNPPLIFGFHGHGGNALNARRSFRLESHWPEAYVVYPLGVPTPGKTDPEGKKNGWQQNPGDHEDRDLKFFDTMLADLRKRFEVPASRTFTMGHSNGGRFTYVLWAARPDQFAGFGPSASPIVRETVAPKPAFIIAGEKDQVVPFVGQRLSINRVARLNGGTNPQSGPGHLKTYQGGTPLQTWVYPGDHKFASDAVPYMIKFFQDIANKA